MWPRPRLTHWCAGGEGHSHRQRRSSLQRDRQASGHPARLPFGRSDVVQGPGNRPTVCLDDVRAQPLASSRAEICRWGSRGEIPDDGLGTQTPWPGCGLRDHGGQILFVEFCDWAIKQHLFTDDDGPETGPVAAGGEGYRPVEETRPAAMTMHAVEKRKATAAAPGQRVPVAASSPAAAASRPVDGGGGHRCGAVRPM